MQFRQIELKDQVGDFVVIVCEHFNIEKAFGKPEHEVTVDDVHQFNRFLSALTPKNVNVEDHAPDRKKDDKTTITFLSCGACRAEVARRIAYAKERNGLPASGCSQAHLIAKYNTVETLRSTASPNPSS